MNIGALRGVHELVVCGKEETSCATPDQSPQRMQRFARRGNLARRCWRWSTRVNIPQEVIRTPKLIFAAQKPNEVAVRDLRLEGQVIPPKTRAAVRSEMRRRFGCWFIEPRRRKEAACPISEKPILGRLSQLE